MSLREIFKLSYWNEQKLSLLIGFLSLVVTVIIGTHPLFLFPEEINYNPEIQLEKENTLLSQQSLIFFENFNRSIDIDEIESFDVQSLSDKEKYISFKLAETRNSERSIIAILTDPNNIIRYSSSPLSKNSMDQKNLANLRLHNVSVDRYIKIKIPDLRSTYIEGTWHLNIYVYNSVAELTLMASKPVEGPVFLDDSLNKNLEFKNYLGFLGPPIAYFIMRIIWAIYKRKEKISKIWKGSSKFNDIKNTVPIKDEKYKKKPYVEHNNLEETRQLKKLEGLVVEISKNGLIRCCPECNKTLNKGKCSIHGKVRGEYDLYLEAKIYDGISEHLSIIKRPVLEKLLSIEINEYINIDEDHLDPRVIEMFSKQMIGKWFLLNGTYSVEGFDVENMKISDQFSFKESLNLYEKWESNKKL